MHQVHISRLVQVSRCVLNRREASHLFGIWRNLLLLWLEMTLDLINDLDELHRGESLSCSILNGCQDLLLSLVPVADVVSDLRARILNHRSVTCTEDRKLTDKNKPLMLLIRETCKKLWTTAHTHQDKWARPESPAGPSETSCSHRDPRTQPCLHPGCSLLRRAPAPPPAARPCGRPCGPAWTALWEKQRHAALTVGGIQWESMKYSTNQPLLIWHAYFSPYLQHFGHEHHQNCSLVLHIICSIYFLKVANQCSYSGNSLERSPLRLDNISIFKVIKAFASSCLSDLTGPRKFANSDLRACRRSQTNNDSQYCDNWNMNTSLI